MPGTTNVDINGIFGGKKYAELSYIVGWFKGDIGLFAILNERCHIYKEYQDTSINERWLRGKQTEINSP